MNCEELGQTYELYALGVLDGSEREALEEHISRNCEICMKEVNRAVESNALMFRSVPKVDPSRNLRRRVLAGFGIETRPLWARGLPWLIAATSFAAVLLMFLNPAPRRAPELSASALDFLSAPGTRQVAFGGGGPHGSVLMHQDKGMLLVVVNLPGAPSGKMYETWIIPHTGPPRPTGQLKFAKDGRATGLIPGPLDVATIKAVAVSLEPAGSDPVSPTTVVFAAPLGN